MVQWFHPVKRVWLRAGGARRLRKLTYTLLNDVARPAVQAGTFSEPPSIFGDSGFLSAVCNEVKSGLPISAEFGILDDEPSRYKLLFSCGTLLDLRSGELRKATTQDRLSKHTGYKFPIFANEQLKLQINHVVGMLNSFWEDGAGNFTPVCDKPELLEKLEELQKVSKAYSFYYGLVEDHDLALWMMRQTARAVAAVPFEEFLYMTNAKGSNGKGCFIKMLQKILGIGHDNYAHTLEFSKHFIGRTRPGNNPEVADCEGKRFVAVNESPDLQTSGELNVELIKQLVAGNDNPVTAMGKYRDPTLFNPQMLLAFFAQSSPQFPQKDGGIRTRLSYMLMPLEFVHNPAPDSNERKVDTEVMANLGTLVPEMIVFITALVPGLARMVKHSRIMLPRPPKVTEDTAAQYMTRAVDCGINLTELAIEYADQYLCEWKVDRDSVPPHRVPASRMEICEHFASVQAIKVNSREVLLRLLRDYPADTKGRSGAYKQHLPVGWDTRDIAVFKSGFNEGGLLGRPGWQLMPMKTVTIKG